MPEPDTFDLDAAFARLERDIAGLSHGPGAARAVSTARRRRRTTIGAAAAVALVAIGAGTLATTQVGDHAEPATSTVDRSDRPVPAPAVLDAASLGRATAGWAGPWNNLDMNANPGRTLNPSCRINNDQSWSESISGGSGFFQTGDGHSVDFGAIRWNDGARAQVSATLKLFQACPGAHTTEVTYADDSHVWFVELPSMTGGLTQTGIAVRGHDVLELAIAPTAGLPDEVQVRLADAMVAALESDSGLNSLPQGGVGRISTPEPYAHFAPDRLGQALGGWQSAWHDGQPDGYPDYRLLHDPCGSTAWADAGMDMPVGANGRFWIHQFSSRAAAGTGYQRISESLQRCAGYAVKTVSSPRGADVLVARGDEDVWVIQDDDWVVAMYVPRSSTPPPDSVSVRMRSAMVGVVDDAIARFQQAQG
jgi:hypothetical protein